ncbi:MAG TPA: hypothetical protein VKY37_03110, partial [Brumimicrobium sp.]|nr:hypothetical protein [Brumimicrobium sp.]
MIHHNNAYLKINSGNYNETLREFLIACFKDTRLISAARFRYQVTIEELNFDAARGLERGKIMQMATGEYIKQGAPI